MKVYEITWRETGDRDLSRAWVRAASEKEAFELLSKTYNWMPSGWPVCVQLEDLDQPAVLRMEVGG